MLTKESLVSSAVLEFFRECCTIPMVNSKTVKNYHVTYDRILPIVGTLRIAELTAEPFNQFLFGLKKSPATVAKYSNHFSKFIRYLHEHDPRLIDRDFRYKLYAPQVDTECKEHIPIDELESLFRKLKFKGQEYYDIAYIYCKTCCRRSELLRSEYCDTDWKAPVFRSDPPVVILRTCLKRGKQRRIPVSGKTIECIRRHLNDAGEIVFGVSGEAFLALLQSMGTDIQCLRRTGLSNLAMACGDLGIVRDVAGHASIVTTVKSYAKYTDEKIRQGMNAVQF